MCYKLLSPISLINRGKDRKKNFQEQLLVVEKKIRFVNLSLGHQSSMLENNGTYTIMSILTTFIHCHKVDN